MKSQITHHTPRSLHEKLTTLSVAMASSCWKAMIQGYARVDLMLEVHRLLAFVDQSPGLPAAIYY